MAFRAFVVAASICALLAADVSTGAESPGRPVYAVTNAGTDGRVLTRSDPQTLAPVGPSASLGSSSQAAAFSPNGSLLAFVEWTDDRPSVHVLDLSRMEWHAQVPLGIETGTVIVRWLDSSRVLVFAERPDGLRVFVLDAMRNRLGVARRVAGHLTDRQQVAVGRTRAAVLIRAAQKIGPARVAVVSAAGPARIATLKQIHEGVLDRTIYRPSLVADPSANRAYVVGGIRDPVAAIDLRTLRVTYRRPFASAVATESRGLSGLRHGSAAAASRSPAGMTGRQERTPGCSGFESSTPARGVRGHSIPTRTLSASPATHSLVITSTTRWSSSDSTGCGAFN
jgi:hypothetical protein